MKRVHVTLEYFVPDNQEMIEHAKAALFDDANQLSDTREFDCVVSVDECDESRASQIPDWILEAETL